jgi:hypothetical protein
MTAAEIRDKAMQERTTQGLKVVLQGERDGDEPFVYYPRDLAQKADFVRRARKAGKVILEGGE